MQPWSAICPFHGTCHEREAHTWAHVRAALARVRRHRFPGWPAPRGLRLRTGLRRAPLVAVGIRRREACRQGHREHIVTFADVMARFVGLSEEEKKAEMSGRLAFREGIRAAIAKWARSWK